MAKLPVNLHESILSNQKGKLVESRRIWAGALYRIVLAWKPENLVASLVFVPIIVLPNWRNGALAHLVERFNGIEEVSGSSPLCSTISPPIALRRWAVAGGYQRFRDSCEGRTGF